MEKLILHQYAGSPFSEKIRALLGYLDLPSAQVEIPVIMPRPLLMPLTGGYRRTPVLQMGREVFCDTALIAKVLARRAPEKALFPENLLAAAEHLAYWADTFLFKVVVAVAFQPKALADNPLFTDEAAAAAFMADRAAFAAGSSGLQMPLEEALNHFDLWLEAFNHQLKRSDFLLGSQPTIADFSVYHCLWFIAERPELVSDLVGYTEVMAWFDRIRAYGHGVVESMSGEEALAIAAAAPALDQQTLGKSVTVVPIDYGLQPVRGTEVKVSSLPEAFSLVRSDEEVGDLLVHFPRMGFRMDPI
ncbi:MAG: hypothetical protein CBC55_10225 [Gammaproteobacteria bacterium TMED95]|nr:glutathione S-transferase [Gammaproteobacteria bacterium]OUV20190.1 MAG: hypothetical protein CBC55_10225 [Gammaproteobacteria bacterium TMED95]